MQVKQKLANQWDTYIDRGCYLSHLDINWRYRYDICSDINWPWWKYWTTSLILLKQLLFDYAISYWYTFFANSSWVKSKAASATDFWCLGGIIPVTTCQSSGIKIKQGGPGTAMKVERSNSVISNRKFSSPVLDLW